MKPSDTKSKLSLKWENFVCKVEKFEHFYKQFKNNPDYFFTRVMINDILEILRCLLMYII